MRNLSVSVVSATRYRMGVCSVRCPNDSTWLCQALRNIDVCLHDVALERQLIDARNDDGISRRLRQVPAAAQ